MIWKSTYVMTAIDLVVIGIVIFAFYSFAKTVRQSRTLEFKASQALTLIGIAVLGIFYSFDLFSIWGLPLFIPTAEAMAFMEQLHLDYRWIVTLIVVGTIITGYVLTNRSIVSLQRKPERPEQDLSAWHLEPVVESGEKAPNELIVLAAFVASLVLAFDLSLPLGIAGGVPYVALVLLGGWFPRSKHIFILAVVASALTAAGFFLSPTGVEPWVGITNRGLALFAIWITATLIATRKRADKALRESEQKNRLILESTGQGIYGLDLDGRAIFVNPAVCEMLGYVADELLHQPMHALIHHSYPNGSPYPREKCLMYAAFNDGTVHHVTDEVLWRKDGTSFPVEYTSTPIREDGEPVGAVVTFKDITKRKRAEEQIILAKEEAERANNAKSELLSSMSHELRTPLNAILGFTQLLNTDPDHPLTEKQLDATEQVLKSGDHLLNLINEVLDLAAIESGKVPLDVEAQDPTPVIESCTAIARNLAEQKGLAFYDRTAGWTLPEINIDETRFRQVLLNLLSNAVKYNRDGGTVTLAVEEAEGGGVRFSVIDSGIGIPEDKHDQIFSPFSRLGLENSDITGSGIGLTITRELVEAMGGSIGFESAPNLGSTFWLAFPIVSGELSVKDRSEEPAPAPSPAAADTPPQAKHTVLCVEDNPSSLMLLESIIERIQDTAMISAHTGELGVDLAEIHHPDVILMDINLPGINGIETLYRLKLSSATKNIPVIALTARASEKDKAQGLEAGFMDYLTKPINVEEVTSALNQAFQGA